MIITTFSNKDLKKSGGFKVKNNIKKYDKTNFKIYVKTNNLKLSKGYIDNIGFIDNGLMFKCNLDNSIVIGVTKIIQEVEEWTDIVIDVTP